MVGKISPNHLRQPSTLPWDRFVHPTPQLHLDVPEPRPHSIPTCLPLEVEGAGPTAAANEGKAEKVESLWLPQSSSRSTLGRKAPKLDQTSFLRMQRQSKLLYPLAQIRQKARGILQVLETDDSVIGIPHHNNIATGIATSPPLCPEVEDIVKKYVGERR
jgi:hypothetical protein